MALFHVTNMLVCKTLHFLINKNHCYICHSYIEPDAPKLNGKPEINVETVDNSNLRLKCTIDPVEKENNVRHEVTWYQTSPTKLLDAKTTLKASKSEAYLENTANNRIFKLNQIVCYIYKI